jgi:hypothetical protein
LRSDDTRPRLTGLDAAGNTIATLVHDVAELHQADAQRVMKDAEIQAATEAAMAAPPTILGGAEPAVSPESMQVRWRAPARPQSRASASLAPTQERPALSRSRPPTTKVHAEDSAIDALG